jgi:hypothetical protein
MTHWVLRPPLQANITTSGLKGVYAPFSSEVARNICHLAFAFSPSSTRRRRRSNREEAEAVTGPQSFLLYINGYHGNEAVMATLDEEPAGTATPAGSLLAMKNKQQRREPNQR